MKTILVFCKACGHSWPARRSMSIYERQSLESRPCPKCAAYTLSLRDESRTLKGPKMRGKKKRGDSSMLLS